MWRAVRMGVCTLLVSGCPSDKDMEDTADPCLRDPPLTWDSWGQGFVEKHCNGCHSSIVPDSHRNNAPKGIDFDTYVGVLTFAERIDARVVDELPTAMPPGGGPTEEELSLLAEWLTCSVYPDVARWQAEQGGGG